MEASHTKEREGLIKGCSIKIQENRQVPARKSGDYPMPFLGLCNDSPGLRFGLASTLENKLKKLPRAVIN